MKRCRTGLQAQRGYSLAEMIVVVAIIGIFSLVAVPQFMNISKNMKMKASMRQFAGDLRAARQRAITRNTRVNVTFSVGTTPAVGSRGAYEIVERQDDGTWRLIKSKKLTPLAGDVIYFSSTDFTNSDAPDMGTISTDDNRPDIVFQGDGQITTMPDGADARVVIRTNWTIPQNSFTYKFSRSGNFTTSVN
jgi:prepilin-type N-terminal cleavage/methylation domain-containing protein